MFSYDTTQDLSFYTSSTSASVKEYDGQKETDVNTSFDNFDSYINVPNEGKQDILPEKKQKETLFPIEIFLTSSLGYKALVFSGNAFSKEDVYNFDCMISGMIFYHDGFERCYRDFNGAIDNGQFDGTSYVYRCVDEAFLNMIKLAVEDVRQHCPHLKFNDDNIIPFIVTSAPIVDNTCGVFNC